MSDPTTSVEGWLQKKPTSQASKPWHKATTQRRYFESRGLHVSYFVDEPSRRAPSARARATFDLRDVTVLRPAADSSAPSTAIDVEVGAHRFTLDFGVDQEMDRWLRLWSNCVPEGAMPETFRVRFGDSAVAAEMLPHGREGSLPRCTWLGSTLENLS